jgi:hypothetical protein
VISSRLEQTRALSVYERAPVPLRSPYYRRAKQLSVIRTYTFVHSAVVLLVPVAITAFEHDWATVDPDGIDFRVQRNVGLPLLQPSERDAP